MIKLSVVIPAYNEVKSLKKGVLNEVFDYLSKQKFAWEVLLVDDGSTDATLKLLGNFAAKHQEFRVLAEPHRGKGGTVIAGMLKARGGVVLFADMDQATPISEVEKFLPKFNEGYDIVIASRAGREGAPVIRKLMAYGFAVLRTLVLRLPYRDTQCGFKAFNRQAARKIFKRMKIFTPIKSGFSEKVRASGSSVSAGFDLEILYLARKLKLRVKEVPIIWHHQEGTKVNPLKDSWEGLRDLLKVRINAILGRYKV
ncbi:glycosyltransferase family 2 protein [Candidatus Woesebacteria bacterium]|nr:glycosyltransferase family 2 protein [Candidatus Woesebacteria bacterium]